MKPYTEIYNEIITSNVFRTDGPAIDLPALLLELGQAVHAAEDPDWYLGEHTEDPLSELIVGAYWALTEWHAGQASDTYAAMCALGEVFKPGCTGPPTPEESEWSAYMLIGQHFGGYVLFEPLTPDAETWEGWWEGMPDAQEGFMILFSGEGEEPCRIPCATREEAIRIAEANESKAGIWKPRVDTRVDTAPAPITGNLRAFCGYLRGTLIPDLREAEMEATAEDFESCLHWIDGLRGHVTELADELNQYKPNIDSLRKIQEAMDTLHG